MRKKSRLRGPLDRERGKPAKNTVSISTTAPLPYLLIAMKVTDLEIVFVSDMENLRTVC